MISLAVLPLLGFLGPWSWVAIGGGALLLFNKLAGTKVAPGISSVTEADVFDINNLRLSIVTPKVGDELEVEDDTVMYRIRWRNHGALPVKVLPIYNLRIGGRARSYTGERFELPAGAELLVDERVPMDVGFGQLFGSLGTVDVETKMQAIARGRTYDVGPPGWFNTVTVF